MISPTLPRFNHTEHTRSLPNRPVRFQGIGPNAVSQFVSDTLGVWAPKMPFVRSTTQFFEDTFLEFVEDGAFYFTVPLAGQYLMAPLMKALYGRSQETTLEALGTALRNQAGTATRELVAAKAGTLFGAVALAAGFEYIIQHLKNVITAQHFKTKNFTAVAGLESARETLKNNEEDPVVKAKRRFWQVGGIVGALLGVSLVLPALVRRSDSLLKLATGTLKHFDFSVKNSFDLSKPLLAILIATGVVSYLDAARGPLERKETGTRLAFVVPYLLFGKELAGNALAWFFENRFIGTGADRFRIKDKVRFLDPSEFQKASFLDFSMVKNSVFEEVSKLPIANTLKEGILKKHQLITLGSYVLSALVVGVGINLLAYHQTRQRFKKQQAETNRNEQPQFQGLNHVGRPAFVAPKAFQRFQAQQQFQGQAGLANGTPGNQGFRSGHYSF